MKNLEILVAWAFLLRGQSREAAEAQATEIVGSKPVKKVGDVLRQVAQLAELAKPHLVGANHLLPPQRTL